MPAGNKQTKAKSAIRSEVNSGERLAQESDNTMAQA